MTQIAVIGVPFSLDQLNTGMGKAPTALLDSGLAQRLETAGATNVRIELLDTPLPEGTFIERMGVVMARLGRAVAHARADGFFPLVLGGDCVTALGTLAGLGDAPNTGVVWFDAHGDFNTPDTTLSGYLGGMPLAAAVGRGLEEIRTSIGLTNVIAEQHVALVGVRDLDPPEEDALMRSGVLVLRGAELAEGSFGRILVEVATLPQVYLHIDIDVLDGADAPGVDFPTPGGLRLDQLQTFVGEVARRTTLGAVALTAVNPERDQDGRTVQSALRVIEAVMSATQA